MLVSFISPFRSERHMARGLLPEGSSSRCSWTCRMAEAEKRDVKGFSTRESLGAGELKHFTGIDSPYEAPENPEIRIDTTTHDSRSRPLKSLSTN